MMERPLWLYPSIAVITVIGEKKTGRVEEELAPGRPTLPGGLIAED
jgi:hypothetical protein